MAHDVKENAARALACLDLTDLEEDCVSADVEALCKKAFAPPGPVAAICIWPRFVAEARRIIGGRDVKIATVVNFPSGSESAADVVDAVERALSDGADEIDMVIPYGRLMEGHEGSVLARVERVKRAAGSARVKAILETGILKDRELIRRASELAIEGGADFIKTSTGKVSINTSLRAARTMLEVISEADRVVGFKPAGGIRKTVDAIGYLSLADEIMGAGWATPETFRIGASSVHAALLATLKGDAPSEEMDGY